MRSPVRRSLTSMCRRGVGEAAADDDDRRDADQLGVLELHAGRHAGAVVEQHPQPGRLELGGQPLGRRPLLGRRLPAITTCTSAGATSRGQHRPRSSSVASAIAATARDTPMP